MNASLAILVKRPLTQLLAICLVAATVAPAFAAISGTTRVARVTEPVYATHAPNDPNRLFIVEKGGSIQILDLALGELTPQPFLSVPDTDDQSEGGLLGLAFHPEYDTNGKFYVYVTVDNGGINIDNRTSPFSSRIREYTVSSNPNIANTSPREVLNWVQPQANHNGGWIGFDPTSTAPYLYITSGDGGKQGDPDGNAQNLTNDLLGKVLRIDVDGDAFPNDANRNYAIPASNPFVGVTGDDEIWSYGLRNPWRASFDRELGDFWIGDVGQGSVEEINRQLADSLGGENYAWNRREGSQPHQGGSSQQGDVEPVYDYFHGTGTFQGNSVVGGVVYRGPDPELDGHYIFADTVRSAYWKFDIDSPDATVERINGDLLPSGGSISTPVAFGEDAKGNVYIVSIGGGIYRIDTDALRPGDYNGDGLVDASDYERWRATYGSVSVFDADGNGDGVVDAADYTVWRANLDTAGTATAAAKVSAAPIPEPSGFVLLLGLFSLATAMALLRWRFDSDADRMQLAPTAASAQKGTAPRIAEQRELSKV